MIETRRPRLLAGIQGEAVKDARRQISAFFEGRQGWSGQPLSQEVLDADLNVYLVVRTGVNLGLKLFHEMLASHHAAGRALPGVRLEDDRASVDLYVGLARECRERGVFLEYSGGMILLWLWLCRGVRFPRSPGGSDAA